MSLREHGPVPVLWWRVRLFLFPLRKFPSGSPRDWDGGVGEVWEGSQEKWGTPQKDGKGPEVGMTPGKVGEMPGNGKGSQEKWERITEKVGETPRS